VRFRYQIRDQVFEIDLERQLQGYRATVGGSTYEVEVLDEKPGVLSLRFQGRPVTLFWAADRSQKWVSLDGCTYILEKPSPRAEGTHSASGREARLRAPMPAQVRTIEAAEGQSVEKGQTLLVLEAMKMEIRLRAPWSGVITRLHTAAGQTVEKDEILVEMSGEPDDQTDPPTG
jgi:biotin carboxyl carrier protein